MSSQSWESKERRCTGGGPLTLGLVLLDEVCSPTQTPSRADAPPWDMASFSLSFGPEQPCSVWHGNRFSSPSAWAPAHPASSLSSRRPEEAVPTAAAGRGLLSKTRRQRSFPVSLSQTGSWAPQTSLHSALRLWRRWERRGAGSSPRSGFERCTAEAIPTPPVTAAATCNHSFSSVCLRGASKRAHKPSPQSRQLWWCPEATPHTPLLSVQTLKPVSVLFLSL